jgi:hypothetical protein
MQQPSITVIFCLLAAAPAVAQEAWPSRQVRLVVPSSPGGATDTYARLLAQGLGEALKRPFIVDNRPGASGNVGAEIAAKAAPDGSLPWPASRHQPEPLQEPAVQRGARSHTGRARRHQPYCSHGASFGAREISACPDSPRKAGARQAHLRLRWSGHSIQHSGEVGRGRRPRALHLRPLQGRGPRCWACFAARSFSWAPT